MFELRPVILPPLPRKVRIRLRWHGWVDNAAYWLVCHGRHGAAIRLWKITGMWR